MKKDYQNATQTISCTLAFLIGVNDESFKAYEKMENIENFINKLKDNNNAQTIRSLCILRNELLKYYPKIHDLYKNLIPLENMGFEIIKENIDILRNIEIEPVKTNATTSIQIAHLNELIGQNIEKVKPLFPDWVKWEYIKKLFLMPGCMSANSRDLRTDKDKKKLKDKVKRIRFQYSSKRKFYPYNCYINCDESKMKSHYGNILHNDEKFLTLLYTINNDHFKASEYVIDAPDETKENIYDFLKEANNVEVYVDCENVDPFKLYAAFKSLYEEKLRKIKKIVLKNDPNANPAWRFFKDFLDVEIILDNVERTLETKSNVDMALALDIAKAHEKNNIDSFILVSSDSDFFVLYNKLDTARFLVLNELNKTANVIFEKLKQYNIPFCILDEFAQSEAQQFKEIVLYNILREEIEDFNKTGKLSSLDVRILLNNIYEKAHIYGADEQLEQEKEIFYKKYLKQGFSLNIEEKKQKELLVLSLISKKTPY